MEREKIHSVLRMYRDVLNKGGIRPVRISPNRTFRSCTLDELLSHALYISIHALEFDPEQHDKLNRHLVVVQMCLSFVGFFTLEQLMEHNRPE